MNLLRNQLNTILQSCGYEYDTSRSTMVPQEYPLQTLHMYHTQMERTDKNMKKCHQISYVRDGDPEAPFLSSIVIELYEE